jgi:hypothetical protein
VSRRAALLVAALWTAGCGSSDLETLVRVDGGAGVDAADGANPDGGDAGFCAGGGPLVKLPGDTCTGDVGQRLFRFAICSCTTVSVSGKLRLDSFTSAGAPSPGDGASIGANEYVALASVLDVGGSIWAQGAGVTGAPTLRLDNAGSVGRDLHVGGQLGAQGTFTVGRDVYLAGDATCTSGGVHALGKLHAPASATIAGLTADGGRAIEAVTIAAPCRCDAPLPIASIVQGFASDNDDAAVGLSPTALIDPAGPIALPCGRFYFDAIHGPVSLKLSGRTAIFVGGDVSVLGDFSIELGPAAALDLFVAGNFGLVGNALFGSTSAPAKLRVYVAGKTLDLSGSASIGANVYAPDADVAMSSNFQMAGAIFTHRLAFSGDAHVRYDESVLDGEGCAPTPTTCSTCDDCGGATPACKGGSCQACTADADCCPPLICNAGKCVPSIR